MKEFLTLSELSKILHISKQGVLFRIKKNHIPNDRIGNVLVIKRADLALTKKTKKRGRPKKRQEEND